MLVRAVQLTHCTGSSEIKNRSPKSLRSAWPAGALSCLFSSGQARLTALAAALWLQSLARGQNSQAVLLWPGLPGTPMWP